MNTGPTFEAPDKSFWVFAYGSLLWQPDFPFTEKHPATLFGYHRALCIYSWSYRGTQQNPGLVFGLDEGGTTQGIAYRISDQEAVEVYEKIHAREMISNVYEPHWVPCHLDDSSDLCVEALAYVANRHSPQYAGTLDDDDVLKFVTAGHGSAGPCTEYVLNTDAHLREMGVCDPLLERIADKLKAQS